ncbi:hypothetical protein [Streptomyces sp. NPDC093594]|uniref:hypothetical protein n=1 Tax=Streptomyces sp. NPDC093594 TaxID=3155305 RepID=UPI00344CC395
MSSIRKFRALSLVAAPVIALGFSGEAAAYDGNTVVYLGTSTSSAARMIHVDNGDTFRVYDDRSDGHGVRGWLEVNAPDPGGSGSQWVHQHTSYNGGGLDSYSYFYKDVQSPFPYRMKVCTVDGPDDTTPVACSAWKTFYE